MKIIDTMEYVSALRELAEQGHEVSMTIAGSSMSPFLVHQRDTIAFKKKDRPLKRGDMVFFQRDSGQYVMHRILKKTSEGYYIVGDAQTVVEGPIREEQIFARIHRVNRKGRWISDGDFWWEFFEKVWIRIVPLRPAVWRAYSVFAGIRNRFL